MPSSAKYISQWLGILFAEYEKLQKPYLHKQIANFIQTEIKNTEVRISELTSLQVQPVLLLEIMPQLLAKCNWSDFYESILIFYEIDNYEFRSFSKHSKYKTT